MHRTGNFFEPLESRQLMAAAGLDPSFNIDGKGTVETRGGVLHANDVAVQADGKTVIVGFKDLTIGGGIELAVARLNFDGFPDPTFGPNGDGVVSTPIRAGKDAFANAVAIQADGKIVVAGHVDDNKEWGLIRLNTDGSLDNTFSSDGKQTIGFRGAINDVLIQQGGQIVLVGTSHDFGIIEDDANFGIARLRPDGQFDRSFSDDGKLQLGFGDNDFAHSVAIDRFGKIVIAGSSNGGQLDVARLNNDGTRDNTFGSKGQAIIPHDSIYSAQGVVIQPSGKLVIAGFIDDPQGQANFLVTRLLSDGRLDGTFGGKGTGTVETDFGADDRAGGMIQTPAGALIVSGQGPGGLVAAKYSSEGLPDQSFGNNGRIRTNTGIRSFSSGIAAVSEKRFVVAGGVLFGAARILDSGANGVAFSGSSSITSIAIETPGIVPGSASFTLTRTETLPIATRVFLNIGGTAQRGTDYVVNKILNTSGSKSNPGGIDPGASGALFVDIPANQNSVIVTLSAKDDSQLEAFETASFTIQPSANYQIVGTATKTLGIEDNDDVHINFQAPGQVVASGYRADVGLSIRDQGDGLSYGWDADNTASVRNRGNAGSPDFRFDSLALMQKDGANRTWEIAVPNGMYQVHLVAGDPSFTDSVYKMNLENQFVISGTPSGDVRWFERTANVLVTDGRLTVSNTAGAVNNKIAFIDIRSVGSGAPEGPVTPNRPISLVTAQPQQKPAPVIVSRVFSQVLI
jgi:uncharacterized delta-60 repeat protein